MEEWQTVDAWQWLGMPEVLFAIGDDCSTFCKRYLAMDDRDCDNKCSRHNINGLSASAVGQSYNLR